MQKNCLPLSMHSFLCLSGWTITCRKTLFEEGLQIPGGCTWDNLRALRRFLGGNVVWRTVHAAAYLFHRHTGAGDCLYCGKIYMKHPAHPLFLDIFGWVNTICTLIRSRILLQDWASPVTRTAYYQLCAWGPVLRQITGLSHWICPLYHLPVMA